MKFYNEVTVENQTEEAFKDGQAIGIITGGVIFALTFLILSVI